MESDVSGDKSTSHQNGSDWDSHLDSQSNSSLSPTECDKAKQKVLKQANQLVSGIIGLTRTNGLTNGGMTIHSLSAHGTINENGDHSMSSRLPDSFHQGQIMGNLMEQPNRRFFVPNGTQENGLQAGSNELKLNVASGGDNEESNNRNKPLENGYGGDKSNSEDEINEKMSCGNENNFDLHTNASSQKEHSKENYMQEKSSKMQAARPKTISWSRMLKQRRDRKNNVKKDKKKTQNSSKTSYLYPELCSSSDEDLDDSNFLGAGHKCLSEKCDSSRDFTGAIINGSTNKNNSSGKEVEIDGNSRNVCMLDMLSHRHDGIDSSVVIPGEIQRMQTLNDIDIMNSSLISAPLALPEDSDGYSTNSSDSNTQLPVSSYPQGATITTTKTSNKTLITQTSQFIYTERTTVDNICFEEHRNLEQAIRPGALPHNSSMDSLEEIGDYIETDFPNKDSRLLFQCSSRSSTSTDEDEGYGVNTVPRNMELEPEGRSLPPESSSFNLSRQTNQNLDTNQLGLKASGNSKLCGCNDINVTFPLHQKQNSRIGSGARKSESESDIGGGRFGSDSSAMYSPETDFLDFLEMDQPSSMDDGQRFSSFDQLNQCLSVCNDNIENSVSDDRHEYLVDNGPCASNFCTNDLRGAEGDLTNDLNFDCRSDEFDPDLYNNMESYDPHLVFASDMERDNFCFHDICKHEKVPRANFKNSESNRQEKIFFKCAMDGNQSSSSGSSDDEENLLHCMPRETIYGPERIPQNSDDTDCMVLEDLEHLTHALQNAVIMQLPNKLEESSGDSSEEPIYEDIDNLEHTITSSDTLPVLPEEPPKNDDNVVKVLPKYERRKRRGHRSHSDVEKVMIWNEYEAYVLQVKQISTSACGATAILNILKAFDYQIDKEEVCKNIQTNLRMEAAPVPYYLFSRSSAGTTADNLIEGVERLTQCAIKGRFFPFFPARRIELLKWLGCWIKKGAVPIATLNLQCGVKPGWTIPDAWHHQMVYGVSSKGVYLTNPLEIVPEEIIMEQLTSDSVLLIRRQDVVNRFRDWAPLNDILKQRDKRWQTMNVLGQVVNVLREACTALSHQVPRYRAQLTSHISIPAAYKAGITLFARNNTDLCNEVFSAPDLELKDTASEELS